MTIEMDGQTQLAGVIATPIKHSLSPLIHNTSFKHRNINAVYLAFDVKNEQIMDAFNSIRVFNMLGANVSMPFKKEAYHFSDVLSHEATLIGAVNTLSYQEGIVTGYNTDGIGFTESLKNKGNSVANRCFTILGAGGAAKAIIVQLMLENAKKITVFKRYNETFKETENMLADLKTLIPTSTEVSVLPFSDEKKMKAVISNSDYLINATQLGMTETIKDMPIPENMNLPSSLCVIDLIYHPLETKLLKYAKNQHCQTMNGLGMLIHQAAHAFHLWTGEDMPIPLIEKTVLKKLKTNH